MSAIFSAIKQVIELFGFDKEVETLSYKDHFEQLWGISDRKLSSDKKIWCVVDDNEEALRWLPIGIWGRYLRARKGSGAPKLILIGKEDYLNPIPTGLNIYVPDLYKDDGLNVINILSPNLISDLLSHIVDFASVKQADIDPILIDGWKKLLYVILSSPDKRHSISNEIAPLILYDSLLSLGQRYKNEKKRVVSAFAEIDISSMNISSSLNALQSSFIINSEQKALQELWQWAIQFISPEQEEIRLPQIVNIWNIWSSKPFLLVDDQAETYIEIVRCALKIITGKDELSFKPSLTDEEIDNINSNYACLLLDLRLTPEDLERIKYEELTGVNIARRVSEKDPSFPIIIFSSSQQRKIDEILSRHKNIIRCFRKPGIAGSIESIDGNHALNNLFDAIQKALEMMENRIIQEKIKNLKNKKGTTVSTLKYERRDGTVGEREINADNEFIDKLDSLFHSVFINEQYENAFSFPYSYFEELFSDTHKELEGIENGIELKSIGNDFQIVNKNYKGEPTRPYISLKKHNDIKLSNFQLCQNNNATFNLSLNVRALVQFRNLAAHYIRNFQGMRREAIAILLLFFSMIENKWNPNDNLLNGRDLQKMGESSVKEGYCWRNGNSRERYHPLWVPAYNLKGNAYNKYIHDLFSSLCYYGNNVFYDKMLALLK